MKTPTNLSNINTPRLFPTLAAGFNVVASNIQLILIPVIIDVALWLGPKLRISYLAKPLIQFMSDNMQTVAGAESQAQIPQTLALIKEFFANFNLGIFIRTIPVGIPSLLARELTVASPLAKNTVYEAPTTGYALLVIAALTLAGFFLGTLYFNALARFTVNPVLPANSKKLFAQYGQNLVTALILLAILLTIMVPGMLIITAASMASMAIGQILILVGMFISVWLIMPLIFAPHGIFVLNQKAYPSMLLSIRMIRFFLPGAGMYVMVSALISEGFNLIWTLADASSWLTLIGIFGHAFIVTALLAASFIYYRGGLKWMQETIQNISDPDIKAKLGGPFGSDKQ
jgi:hypothetical protein